MIVIVEYGLGNPRSIQNMLRRLGAESIISNDSRDIESASRLILPGVGAFDHGMQNLRANGLDKLLSQRTLVAGVPFLGVCIGMQLLGKSSEEGQSLGLGWLDARTVRFKFKQNSQLKIPHMGWNEISINQSAPTHPIVSSMSQGHRFYYVHSYHLELADSSCVLASCKHGYEFPAIVALNNIAAAQFHPEKSHKFGMQLFSNFINWQPQFLRQTALAAG